MYVIILNKLPMGDNQYERIYFLNNNNNIKFELTRIFIKSWFGLLQLSANIWLNPDNPDVIFKFCIATIVNLFLPYFLVAESCVTVDNRAKCRALFLNEFVSKGFALKKKCVEFFALFVFGNVDCNLGNGLYSTKWYEQCYIYIYEKYVYWVLVSVFQ